MLFGIWGLHVPSQFSGKSMITEADASRLRTGGTEYLVHTGLWPRTEDFRLVTLIGGALAMLVAETWASRRETWESWAAGFICVTGVLGALVIEERLLAMAGWKTCAAEATS